MKTLTQQIEETEAQIHPLKLHLVTLKLQLRREQSKAFIAEHQIRLEDVEMSSSQDKDWFSTCFDFGRWMRTHACTKKWAEWNGQIVYAQDLKMDKLRETPSYIHELEGYQS